MKKQNQHLKPPPRKPWLMDNTSSSSLRGMEIGLPPGQPLPPPSPAAVAVYEAKPLPAVPPSRRSGISTFSDEVRDAFRTPVGSINYHISTTPKPVAQEQEADIAVILDTETDATAKSPNIVLTGNLTDSPVEVIHSPLPKKIQRLLGLTALAVNISRSGSGKTPVIPSPSGHNPPQKIKRIMGVNINSGKVQELRGPLEEVSPLTPESCASRVYSTGDAAVSPETDAQPENDRNSTHGTSWHTARTWAFSGLTERSTLWPPLSPSEIPASLTIAKAIPTPRDTSGQEPPPVPPSRHPNHHNHASPLYRHDLYHAIAVELARNPGTSPSTPASPFSRGILHVDEHHLSTSLSPGNFDSTKTHSFNNRVHHSKVRIAPPIELSKLDTLSSKAFSTSKPPIRSPYPPPIPSRFDIEDEDSSFNDTDGHHTKDSSPSTNNTTGAARRSVLHRVFSSGTSTSQASSVISPGSVPPPPVPTPTNKPPNPLRAPPRLHNRAVKSQANLRPRPSNSGIIFNPVSYTAPPSRSVTPAPLAIDRVAMHAPRAAPPIPGSFHTATSFMDRSDSRSRARASLTSAATSLSVWAAKTSELVGQARQVAGFKSKAERRRDELKGRIRVVMPGVRVGGGLEALKDGDGRALPRGENRSGKGKGKGGAWV